MSLRIGTTQRFYGLIGVCNLLIGVMFYTINITPPPVRAYSPPLPPQQPTIVKPIPATTGIPTRIIIPSLAIDLPVGIGSYNKATQTWTLNDTQAFFAKASMPLNNSNGTSLIYGHARTSVFASLPQLQPGAVAKVHTDTGYVFHYKHTTMKQVEPNDTTVFTPHGPPKLVLQTCTGDWSQFRALFNFKLTAIKKL